MAFSSEELKLQLIDKLDRLGIKNKLKVEIIDSGADQI
jgi:hypothetical protein